MKEKYLGLLRLYWDDIVGQGVLICCISIFLHILVAMMDSSENHLMLVGAVAPWIGGMMVVGMAQNSDLFFHLVRFGQTRRTALLLWLALLGTELALFGGMAAVMVLLERYLAPSIWMWVRGLEQVVYTTAYITDRLPHVLYVEPLFETSIFLCIGIPFFFGLYGLAYQAVVCQFGSKGGRIWFGGVALALLTVTMRAWPAMTAVLVLMAGMILWSLWYLLRAPVV